MEEEAEERSWILDYSSNLLDLNDEELKEEKRKREKVPVLFHITATNVYHSQLSKTGELKERGTV